MKIWASGILALALLCGGCGSKKETATAQAAEAKPVVVRVAAAEARTVPLMIQATGSFVADESSDVAPKVAGRIAAGALDYATNYAKERIAFGKPIGQHQGVGFMLADMKTEVEAARLMLYEAARRCDEGAADVTLWAAMAKLKSVSDAGFDRAYVENEVTYHKAVIDALNNTLAPAIQNAELKALLVKVRPAGVVHWW